MLKPGALQRCLEAATLWGLVLTREGVFFCQALLIPQPSAVTLTCSLSYSLPAVLEGQSWGLI